jgi:cytochrome c553
MRKRTPLLFLSIAVAVVAAVATFGWVTIRRGFSARGNPSALEAYLAKTARSLSIPASDRDAKNPFVPTADVLGKTRSHFADHCATCHGNDGSEKRRLDRISIRNLRTCAKPKHRTSQMARFITSSTMEFDSRECPRLPGGLAFDHGEWRPSWSNQVLRIDWQRLRRGESSYRGAEILRKSNQACGYRKRLRAAVHRVRGKSASARRFGQTSSGKDAA